MGNLFSPGLNIDDFPSLAWIHLQNHEVDLAPQSFGCP